MPPPAAAPGPVSICFFFFNDTATPEIYPLSLHDALPISQPQDTAHHRRLRRRGLHPHAAGHAADRSEEHTSELQSRLHLVCRLLLEKKKSPDGTDPASRSTSGQWEARVVGFVRISPLVGV